MATAKADEVEVMVPTTEKRIVLTLTEQEAKVLVSLLNQVGGAPKNAAGKWAPRGILTDKPDAVYNALREAVGNHHFTYEGEYGDPLHLSGAYIPGETKVVHEDAWSGWA